MIHNWPEAPNLFETMVRNLEEEFHRCSDDLRDAFIKKKSSELIDYHSTLGRNIRNIYSLFSIPWEPVMKNGTDVSPDHPDAVSMRVIEEVHKRLTHPH